MKYDKEKQRMVHDKDDDPYDIFDSGDITRLAERGTKADLDAFMRIWASVEKPPWEWTSLAQDIYSSRVKSKAKKREKDRDDRLCCKVKKYLHDRPNASQNQAFIAVARKHPEDNSVSLKKIYQRWDSSVYDAFSVERDIHKDS